MEGSFRFNKKNVTIQPFENPLNPPSPHFSKGEKLEDSTSDFPKALLPLKKGEREGFLGRPFQNAKALKKLSMNFSAGAGFKPAPTWAQEFGGPLPRISP
jgi:hypothetical protein